MIAMKNIPSVPSDTAALTPMLKQYLKLKREYPDTILFFRLGDFYEMFFEDARIGSRVLEITLTSREGGEGERVPMAGVPYHAADNYIARLIKGGYKVTICEQTEDPKMAKGLVRREVVRVITPGTLLTPNLLNDARNNYLVSILPGTGLAGLAVADLSTGEFRVTELKDEEKLTTELFRLSPAECLMPESFKSNEPFLSRLRPYLPRTVTFREDWQFGYEHAYQLLTSTMKVTSLEGFGCENMRFAVGAGGALCSYLEETQKMKPSHLNRIYTYTLDEFMLLDANSRRNLELTSNLKDGSRKGTLISVLDYTETPMGRRLLCQWLHQPLIELNKIRERLDAVEELVKRHSLRGDCRTGLKEVQDLERLLSRICLGIANARDMLALSSSLKIIPALHKLLSEAESKLLSGLKEELPELPAVTDLIDRAIADQPPLSLREGGLIRGGYNAELDSLRQIAASGKEWISQLKAEEIKRTGISSLKVGYNQVFGYYIEVTRPNLHLVPPDFIRKQTLANAERFITPALKEYEEKVLGAEEKIVELEYTLFTRIREEVAGNSSAIQQAALSIAALDTLLSLSEAAVRNNYCKPDVNREGRIFIQDGRHPVVEELSPAGKFVPNDTLLDTDENELLIITGPNMAGKSTYIRQVALIVLMAQTGGFVPARKAEVGIVDRIFTRVGAWDDLASGRSTFMVEMNETANILNHATPLSLIILDEIGRGTSTFDGLSIAWAAAEYIHNHPKIHARTLFATHYHELAELSMTLKGVKNYNVAVREWNDRIIFLYKVIEGSTDHSYGIQVARLAGLPEGVISRAKEILSNLELQSIGENNVPMLAAGRKKSTDEKQLDFFASKKDSGFYLKLKEELKRMDLAGITPLEALNKLSEWQKASKENGSHD